MSKTVKKILPSGQPPAQSGQIAPTMGSQSMQRAVLRVNRACTSCRKHKMRCEGADDPPCVRCKGAGIECVFESIKKEHALDSVAIERLSSLENQFKNMQGTMQEILGAIKGATGGGATNGTGNGFAGNSSGTSNGNGAQSNDGGYYSIAPEHTMRFPSSSGPQTTGNASTATSNPASNPSPPTLGGPGSVPSHHSLISPVYTHTPSPPGMPSHQGSSHAHAHAHVHSGMGPPSHSPHNSTFQTTSTTNGTSHVSPTASSHSASHSHPHPHPPQQHQTSFTLPTDHPVSAVQQLQSMANARRSPRRRQVNGHGIDQFKSIPTSAATSDDEGELPPKALLAPIEVLSDLASVAAAQAGVGSPEDGETPPHMHGGKKRKLNDGRATAAQGIVTYGDGPEVRARVSDVVEKGIISEEEARDLYRIYFSGCYRFLAVFNPDIDTFESLRQRSPFVLCAILMVSARVRDGGGPPSRVHTELFQEASNLARDTLFSQPQGVECVQAMLLLAGWSSKTGWLAAGHGIRMGMEIGMHKALPRLVAKMRAGRHDPSPDLRTSGDALLINQARTWLGLFVFELQIGRGTGRPAMIRGDKSISEARHLLTHPLSILTDARLVSTCELLMIQTRIHDTLDEERDYDKVVSILREGGREIDDWHTEWDFMMSEKHPDAAGFFRSSAQIQRMYAVLFMHSIALRELRTVQDAKEHPQMHEVMMTAVHNARGCIEICLEAPEYREGLRYAVTYTHTSAAFAAAFLLRFARLFPQDVDIEDSIRMVESLIRLFSEIPAARFVFPLRQMVEFTHKRLEELKAGVELPSTLASRIPPTPPSQFTNDFQSIMNPPNPPVFDPGMSMFPVDPNSTTMEWAAAVNMLDGFGLPPSMSTNGGSLGWLPNSILGDLAVPPSQTENDGIRDWSLQFAFDI